MGHLGGAQARWIRLGAGLLLVVYLAALGGAWLAATRVGDYGLDQTREVPAGSSGPHVVDGVEPGGALDRAGIQPGDVLLADTDIAPAANAPIVIRVQRVNRTPGAGGVGQAEEISIVPTPFITSPVFLQNAVTSTGIAVPFILIGVAVVLARPLEFAPRLLLVFGSSIAIAQALRIWLYSVPDAQMWNLINYEIPPFLNVVAFAALLHLFLVFPTQKGAVDRLSTLWPRQLGRWRKAAALLPYLALLTPVLFVPAGAGLKSFAYLLVALLVVAALVTLFHSYRHPATPLVAKQIKWIMWALVIIVFEVLFSALPSALSEGRIVLIPPLLIPLFASVLPLSIGFAIIRYRLFEVDRIVRLTVLYGLLAGLLIIGYLALAFALSEVALSIARFDATANQTLPVIAALTIAGIALPLRAFLQRMLDRLVFRTRVARSRFMQEASDFLGRAQPVGALTSFLTVHATKSLDLDGAWLVLPLDMADHADQANFVPPPLAAPANNRALFETLRNLDVPAVLTTLPQRTGGVMLLSADSPVLADWYAAGARVFVPLRVAQPQESDPQSISSIAIWVLGQLRSGDLLEREDLAALASIGRQAALLLGYIQLGFRQVQQALLAQDLARAREIQNRLLPAPFRGWPGRLEVASRLQPAREASGDFFDFYSLEGTGGRVAGLTSAAEMDQVIAAQNGQPVSLGPVQFTVGDVQGKGISAALVMGLAHMTLRSVARRLILAAQTEQRPVRVGGRSKSTGDSPARLTIPSPSPGATLSLAGALLHQTVGMKDFVACVIAVVDPQPATGIDGVKRHASGLRLRLANAAQVPPLLCRDGEVTELIPPGNRLPLGVEAQPYYEQLELQLEPGDVVVFASDGLPEAPAANRRAEHPDVDEMFGFERLAASARNWAASARSAEDVLDGIWRDVTAWSGSSPRHDDMTLLVLRVPDAAAGVAFS